MPLMVCGTADLRSGTPGSQLRTNALHADDRTGLLRCVTVRDYQLAHILERQLDGPEAELLGTVLVALDQQVRSALADSVVGVYLTGSFALRSGDIHSDVDFLVVTRNQLTTAEEHRVRGLHRAYPDRPEHWARVLEGSYAPRPRTARPS